MPAPSIHRAAGASTRRRIIAGAVVAVGVIALVACDSKTSTYVPPAFTLPTFNFPTTTTSPPDPYLTTGPVVTLASETSTTTTTTDVALPVIDPPTPPDVVDLAVLPVPPPSPPPGCTVLLAAVSLVTGPMPFPAGEEGVDAAAGHDYTKCYGNVLAAIDAPFDTHSYSFEIWSFPAGAPPSMLTEGSSPYTDPASYTPVDDSRIPAGTWTAVDETNGKYSSSARRATFLPCAGGGCWLYLEDGAAYSGPVTAHLVDSIVTITNALAPGAAGTLHAGGASTLPNRPTCADMRAPIDEILAAFNVSALRLPNDEPDLDTTDYIGCEGSLEIHPPLAPPASTRRISYTIFVVDPARAAILDALPPAGAPTPELGDSVTSDGGTFSTSGTNDPRIDSSTATRAAKYSCGAFICWIRVYEWAYAPADPNITFLDAQLKQYIELSRTAVAALAGTP
ncbi:MAG: hypothetical protein ABIR32_20910 [Ilumatobacteraceae bacterium]